MCIPNGPNDKRHVTHEEAYGTMEPQRFGKTKIPPYGIEMILDLYDCNPKFFTRMWLTVFLEKLCKKIDMEREDLHFWDYEDATEEEKKNLPPHLEGVSLVQFIKTSNITIHTLVQPKLVLLNIFTCKDFDVPEALLFCRQFFEAEDYEYTVIKRATRWREYLPKERS